MVTLLKPLSKRTKASQKESFEAILGYRLVLIPQEASNQEPLLGMMMDLLSG